MDKKSGKYELDEITIRRAENGFVVRCSKKLSKEARAEQEKNERKTKSWVGTSPEYYQSEEYVAETKESALKRVSAELDEYAGGSGDNDDQKETNHENYQAGELGFR